MSTEIELNSTMGMVGHKIFHKWEFLHIVQPSFMYTSTCFNQELKISMALEEYLHFILTYYISGSFWIPQPPPLGCVLLPLITCLLLLGWGYISFNFLGPFFLE